ncbi:uncharacterized protein MELLADRAFT_88694 [Melampsora larici-populina 98AG31]|uniref:PCI domain-containing protein n=1 Tax=Melampsora larici-populina (strain 98AG31 / pathotype 3-4-7) TaxID=747676 RepID=F4RSN1_MELLP|nr:uncharacterized protein MELLADRAFT_88694 [Melampsora larici-populina 98AG31]EGG04663.1 hypothetical protein MELLADRAFT_88694 [Melampsora larici-populina 98AG31]
MANESIDQLIYRFVQSLLQQQTSIGELIRPLDQNLLRSLKPLLSVRAPAHHLTLSPFICISQSRTSEQRETIIERQLGSDRTLFDFLKNYLDYVANVELVNGKESPNGPNQHDLNFELLLNVYNPASNIFRRSDAVFFTSSIQHLSHALVHLAITADKSRQSNKNEKASEAARQMTTTLGISCIDRSVDEPSKRRAAFSLANGLFKIYFFLNNMRLCDTVIKNTSNVIHQLETHYPKSELVTFYYYLGRLSLYQRRLHQARNSLQTAFDLCLSKSWKNPASLPLGILPAQGLLNHFSLQDSLGPVVQAVRTGDWPMLADALDKNMEWFRSKGIYLLMREKLEVICWRNFFVIAAGLQHGKRGMRLSLTSCVEVARRVFMEETIDEQDIECMACSLIDQGYLKAYVKLGEMIVFGATLPKIESVGHHLSDGIQSRPKHATPGINSSPMSQQNSVEMPNKPKIGFPIKGTGKPKGKNRF